ncbi:transmembrane protein, putative, partial [Bodo saltans]
MSQNAQAVSMELFTPPHDDAPSLPCDDSIHAQGGVDTAPQAPPSPSDEMDVGVDAGQRRAPSSHPYSPTQQHESIATIVRRILVLGFPFNVSQVSQLSITLVMFAAVGQFGSEALGGAALANGLMNATGYAFGAGLSGALETLLSHCYGHNPKSLLFGTHAQRMILLQLIVALPLGLLIANIGSILVWMGQSPDVVAFTTQYALIGVWALVPFMFLEVMRRYYATQHVSTPITVIIVVAAVLNIPLQHYLPSALGFVGAPIGWLILLVTMDLALVGYLVVTGLYRNTWGGWNRSALRHWGPMVKLAFPSLIMTLCEWSAMEINTIASGFAPPTELAAFTIMMQTALTMWTMPAGNYIAAAVLVGNCIGERRPLLGRTYAIVCLAISFAISCCSVSIMLLLGEALPRCFTDDSSEKKKVCVSLFRSPFLAAVSQSCCYLEKRCRDVSPTTR